MLAATSPTLIKALPNGTGAVAVDPPSIDVISTPSTLSAGCPVTTQSTINSYDLGVGSFTPAQLLVTPNSSTAWILSNLSNLLGFNVSSLAPSTVPAGGRSNAFIRRAYVWTARNYGWAPATILSIASIPSVPARCDPGSGQS